MKKKVAIIGVTGMLGSMVYDVLQDKFDLLLIYRSEKKLHYLFKTYGKSTNHKVFKMDLNNIYEEYILNTDDARSNTRTRKLKDALLGYDAVINCSGIIKPFAIKNPQLTFFINSALPHILSRELKGKLIQVTTDCVFDGVSNPPFDELSIKKPNDLYGLSKSLGEPEESLVLRTSIIGPELGTKFSLLEWARSNKGKEVYGYENHLWNGVTTREFGNICFSILSSREKFPEKGVFHIFSNPVSKYKILSSLNDKYHLNLKIKKKKVRPVDRRLATVYKLNDDLGISSFEKMIEEL